MITTEYDILLDAGVRRGSGGSSLVSVTVTAFNYGHFLPECLDSVAGQTHQELELIVVDDMSGDATAQIAEDWLGSRGDRFERVRLVRHRTNEGLSRARNTAFRLAEGGCVFVLDADNALYPRAIARLLEAIEEAEAGVAYSQLEFFGDLSRIGVADVWNPASFIPRNYVDAMSLVSKKAWERVGGYRDMNYGWEDYELWCKFIEHGIEGAYVPEILCRYRVHGGSMTSRMTAEQQRRLARTAHEITALHPWLDVVLPPAET